MPLYIILQQDTVTMSQSGPRVEAAMQAYSTEHANADRIAQEKLHATGANLDSPVSDFATTYFATRRASPRRSIRAATPRAARSVLSAAAGAAVSTAGLPFNSSDQETGQPGR